MLRATYCCIAVFLLLAVCPMQAAYHNQVVAQPSLVVADGPDPVPPPLPLAVPLRALADGPDPVPPPLPLAFPA